MKKPMCILFAILLTGSLMTGCKDTVSFLSGDQEVEAQVVTSKEIKIPIERIRSLNPVISKDEDAYYIDKLLYEGLFTLDENLRAVGVLAQEYAYNQEDASLTIGLKSGVKWHDGELFSADDVKFSIDSYLAALYQTGSLYNSHVDGIRYARVKNDNTVIIYFKSNEDMALENLTFPILPKHQFGKSNGVRTENEKFVPIGTGPYKVTAMNPVEEIKLEGFSEYHGGSMADNTLIFRVMPNKLDAIKLFDINDLSITFSKEMNRDTLSNNKDVQLISFPSNEVELVGFNCEKAVLKDNRVRKAIAATIDSEEIMDTGYFKSGVLNDSIYYPGYMGIESTSDILEMNVENAKRLLVSAGYMDRDGNGFAESLAGEEISIEILVNGEDQSRSVAAQIIKSGLEKLPIHSFIKETDRNGYKAALASGRYDIFVGGYRIQESYDLRFLLHSGTGNPAGYSNEQLDVLLDRMQSGISPEEQRSTFMNIKNILMKDMPYYCLFYKTHGAIASESLKGEVRPYFFNQYAGCEGWSCEYKQIKENKAE